MRHIERVFIHCSDSDHKHHDDIKVIRKWHVEERGWQDVGYHYFIKKNGEVQNGRPLHLPPAAQKGHNARTFAICLSGRDHFTQKQFDSLRDLCAQIDDDYDVTFHGHREVAPRTCPNFDYKSVLRLDLEGNMNRSYIPKVFVTPKYKPTLWERIKLWWQTLGE